MSKSIRVFAPATVANLSAGYDVLGLAVHVPGDEVVITLNDTNKITLDEVTGDDGKLPRDPEKNIVSAVVKMYLQQRQISIGASISLHKKMPFGSGLGSSSASAVAGLIAINALMDQPWERKALLPLAMEGERLACGSAHADNVAPSLLGGVVLIRSYDPLDVISLPVPEGIFISLVYPHVNVPTGEARKIIKPQVSLKDAVTQWGNVGGIVAGFCTNDIDLIGRSMQDVIIEPTRAILIPHFYTLKQIALEQGALGFSISGSGPTVFALSKSETIAQNIAQQLNAFLLEKSVISDIFVSEINPIGAKIL
jgi:homoserine kinase